MRFLATVMFALFLAAQSVASAQLVLDPEHAQHKLIIAEFLHTNEPDVEYDLIWIVDSGVDSEEMGVRLFLAAPPREEPYSVQLIVQRKQFDYEELESGRKFKYLANATITHHVSKFRVTGDAPKPPDEPPNPPDEPRPPNIPDGAYQLTKLSYTLASAVAEPFKSRYIKDFVESFKIAARSKAIPSAALKELASRNRKILGLSPDTQDTNEAREAWMVFFGEWNTHVQDLYERGVLPNTTSEHQRAFDATANGLEAASD